MAARCGVAGRRVARGASGAYQKRKTNAEIKMTTRYERKQIETNEGVFPPDALKRAREHRRLAHEFLKAAQTPGIATLPRVTLTVESVYLCALAALGLAADNYVHPSRDALVTGARLAGLSKKQIDAIADCLEYRYEPACSNARWQLPLDLLTTAAKTMLKAK